MTKRKDGLPEDAEASASIGPNDEGEQNEVTPPKKKAPGYLSRLMNERKSLVNRNRGRKK